MPTTTSGFFLQCASRGTLELVLPAVDAPAGVEHHRREAPAGPWRHAATFARDIGPVGAVALIQSNFGDPGHLEVVVRAGDLLAAFWCAPDGEPSWSEPRVFAENAAGDPALIQGSSGGRGDFELVVPHAGGGLAHYCRENDTAELGWRGPVIFGAELGRFESVAMIQRRGAAPGGLEVVARLGDRLLFFWRSPGPDRTWHGPEELVSGVRGTPALLENTSVPGGALELFAPLASAGLASWIRRDGAGGARFRGPAVFAADLGRCEAVSLIESLGRAELVVRAEGQIVHLARDGERWVRRANLRGGSPPLAPAAPSPAAPRPPGAAPSSPGAAPSSPGAAPPSPTSAPPPSPGAAPPSPGAAPPSPASAPRRPPAPVASGAAPRLRAGPHRAGFRRIGALSLSADACYPGTWPFQGAIYSSPAQGLALLYYPASADGEEAPLSPGGPFPVIAIAHERRLRTSAVTPGAPPDIDQDYRQLAGVMAHLARWGFAVIAPDLSWLTPDEAPLRRAAVLRDALSHLRAGSRGPLLADFDRVGLLGHGSGALAALALSLDAASPFHVRAVALLAPAGEPGRAPPADALAPRPLLVVRGTADPAAAFPGALYDRARAPKHLVTVPGANHFGYTTSLGLAEPLDAPAEISRREQQAIAMGYLAAFFDGYLRDARGSLDALSGRAALEGLDAREIPVSAEVPGGGAGR